jgi:hypothetical protein
LLVLSLSLAAALPHFSSATQKPTQQERGRKNREPEAIPGQILVRFRKGASSAKAVETQPLTIAGGRQIDLRVQRLAGSEIVIGLRLAHVAPEDTENAGP